MADRGMRAVKRLMARGKKLVSKYSKEQWEADQKARKEQQSRAAVADQPEAAGQQSDPGTQQEEQPTQGQSADGTGVTRAPAAHTAASSAGRAKSGPAPQAPKRGAANILNEVHAVMIFILPNGKMKTAYSEQRGESRLVMQQLDLLEAAMDCNVREERITASNHAKAEARLRQKPRSTKSRVKLLPLSRVALHAARQAFTQHVRPMLGGVKVDFCCRAKKSSRNNGGAAFVAGGSTACAAGGACAEAPACAGVAGRLAVCGPQQGARGLSLVSQPPATAAEQGAGMWRCRKRSCKTGIKPIVLRRRVWPFL